MQWHKLLFWEFRRGSWQYDLVVLAILAFLFLTPRSFFKDTPRPRSVSLVRTENGASVFWIDPDALASDTGRESAAIKLLETHAKWKATRVQVTPVVDSEGTLKGYLAHAYR